MTVLMSSSVARLVTLWWFRGGLGGVWGFGWLLGVWRPGLRLERRRKGLVIGLWLLASGTYNGIGLRLKVLWALAVGLWQLTELGGDL